MSGEVFIPISFFACAFGIAYLVISTRNRERMAMIEKGVDASFFVKPQTLRNHSSSSLRFGIVLVSVAIGLLLGHLLNQYGNMPKELSFFSMTFLLSGIGLIVFHLISQKNEK